MSEQITGEQLERASYDPPNITVKCHECGAEIDLNRDNYWPSPDGERFCCFDCHKDVSIINTFKIEPYLCIAEACHGDGLDIVKVEVRARTEPEAIKKACEYADMINEGVGCYLEA